MPEKSLTAAAEETGIPEGTPVTFGAVDGLAEGISVGIINPGDLMIMYGSTTGFYLPIEKPEPTGNYGSSLEQHKVSMLTRADWQPAEQPQPGFAINSAAIF